MMADPVLISRRAFNERLLETLPVPPAEREQLLDQARKESAVFARDLVSRGLLTPQGMRLKVEPVMPVPDPARNIPPASPPQKPQ